MKTTFFISLLACLISTPLHGQGIDISNFSVTSRPGMPGATGEGAPNGAFHITHSLGTNLHYPLRVYYEVGGTASSGVDYEALPGYVDFEIGNYQAIIPIVPIDDTLIETNETITLTLLPCPTNAPYPYILRYPIGNTITIVDNDPLGDILPRVGWNYPHNGDVYNEPANVRLSAYASDMDGFVRHVEFFANGTRLGILTNPPSDIPAEQIYLMTWSNAPAGTHIITAVATDDRGATNTKPVTILVLPSGPQAVLTITASDPTAAEDGWDSGQFTITRTIPAGASSWWFSNSLRVYFNIDGTAGNGFDYYGFSPYVIIPPNVSSVTIPVDPLEDTWVEGNETVALRLYCPSYISGQPPYAVGSPSNAVVTIADNDTVVIEMQVAVRSATNVYTAPASFTVSAGIVEPAETVYTVELFEGTNSLGQREWDPRVMYFVDPLSWRRANLPAGTYTYTAVFNNALGQRAVSPPWTVNVLPASTGPGCAGSLDVSYARDGGPWVSGNGYGTSITSITPQPDGSVIIAGTFTNAQWVAVPGIARLTPEGLLDTNYVANTNDVVTHQRVSLPDGKSLQIQWPQEYGPGVLARLNADGTPDTEFIPALPNGFNAKAVLLQPDGKILVAGGYVPIWTEESPYAPGLHAPVMRLLSNGARDDTFMTNTVVNVSPGEVMPEGGVTIYDMVQQADGRIYICGYFSSVNGVRRTEVARLNADGSLDLSFEPDFDMEPDTDQETGAIVSFKIISALGLAPDGKLFVAGHLGSFNLMSRNSVARLHTAHDGCAGIITVEQTGYYVYETNSHVTVAYVRTAGINQSLSIQYRSYPDTARAGQDYVDVQGEVSFAPGEVRKTVSIPLINDTEMEHSEEFMIQPVFWTTNGPVNFVSLSGRFRAGITIYDDDSAGLPGTVDESFVPPLLDGGVTRLVLGDNGRFFAAGTFTHAGGQARTGLARFSTGGQLDSAFNPVLDGPIYDMAFDTNTGKLYIGGEFNHVNGVARRAIARLNGDGSLDDAFNPSAARDAVHHLALCANGQVLIAGNTISHDPERYSLVRLNADGSLDESLNIGTGVGHTWYGTATNRVSIMALVALPDGKILIGGNFDRINGRPCSQVSRLNADGTMDPSYPVTPLFGFAMSMRLSLLPDGKILAGGQFYGSGGYGGPLGLLRLNADGALDPTWHQTPSAMLFAVQPDCKILINSNQRLFPDGRLDLDYWPTELEGGAAETLLPDGQWLIGGVADLLALPNGEVIAGGSFITAEGRPTPYLARLNGGDSRSHGPGFLEFAGTGSRVNGAEPGVTLQVVRIYGAVGTATVDYTTVDDTATNGVDYIGRSGTLAFVSGEVGPKNIMIPFLNNPNREGNVSFRVVLSNPLGGARLGDRTYSTVTMIDTNVYIHISPQIVSVSETNQSVGFRVWASSGSTTTPMTVLYATHSGTAIAGSDFTGTNGMLTVGGGYGNAYISVPILNDDLVEGTETFTVSITYAPPGAIVSGSSATVLIRDDETPPADIATFTGFRQSASGEFTLTVGSEIGRPYVIECSTNLIDWRFLGVVTNFADTTQFIDQTPDANQRFYRAKGL